MCECILTILYGWWIYHTYIALLAGGAIHSSLSNSIMKIRHCNFTQSEGSYGGSVYFGDDHDNIFIEHSIFSYGLATYGGGIYFTTFNADVHISNCLFFANRAMIEGGAIFSLAHDMDMVLDSFVNNSAKNAGAVSISSENVGILNSSFSGNRADESCGGICIRNARKVRIRCSVFRDNMGGVGGALVMEQCSDIEVASSTFESNQAESNAGGLYILLSRNVEISKSFVLLSVSRRGNGAGMFFDAVDNATVRDSTFANNAAIVGSGSAIFATITTPLVFLNNSFMGNRAPLGGGTVYWESDSGMDKPLGLSESWGGNYFSSDNIALYGNHVATEATHIGLLNSPAEINITDYHNPVPYILVYSLDAYDQIVASEYTTNVEAAAQDTDCYEGSGGYLTGSVVEQFHAGVANISALFAYCAPGGELTVSFFTTVQSLSMRTQVTFYFRDCQIGEYFAERVCWFCEKGTYSITDPHDIELSKLTQKATCHTCPSGAMSCHANTIVLKRGHWRISESSDNVMRCPLGEVSCKGGQSVGQELCATGYEGDNRGTSFYYLILCLFYMFF